MSIEQIPRLYNDQEAAEILRCSEFTVSRLRRSGKLGYTRVSSKPYITDKHINEYLRRQECTATSNDEKKTASGTSGNTTTPLDSAASTALALEIARRPIKPSRNSS